VSLDHVAVVAGGAIEEELYARFENGGGAIPSGRMQFTVWGPAGEVIWTAWYGDLLIAASSRETVSIKWAPGKAAPGTYAYGFAVRDEGSGTPYAQVRAKQGIEIGG